MARQPKLILRESAVWDFMKAWNPGTFLEVGCGTGYMTRTLLDRGYTGACYEPGNTAREQLHENLRSYRDKIRVLEDLTLKSDASFDYLFAFEVLEHIEDDLGALKQWCGYLNPGAKFLLTVPAHQKKLGIDDELVGHVRRYERKQIKELLTQSGFINIQIANYGFPLSDTTRFISSLLVSRVPLEENSKADRNLASSHSRQKHIKKIIDLAGEYWVLPFTFLQRPFYAFDLSDSIIATATFGNTR